MNKETMLWDKDKMYSCKANKIREINIYRCHNQDPKGMEAKVIGWYNSSESFIFGYFPTTIEARIFVENLHEQIRGEI